MYQGGLVTFRIKDSETLVAISLLDIDTEINENGLLLKYRKDGKDIGYFADVTGINFDEMMQILGYEIKE